MLVALLVASSIVAVPSSTANAATCPGPTAPTTGSLSTTHFPGGSYKANFSFVLTQPQRDSLICVGDYLEIDFHLKGFYVPSEWDDYTIVETNLPGAIHDVAYTDPANEPTPGVTRIYTRQLEVGKQYSVTLEWNELDPYGWAYVWIGWVPSRWANFFSPNESVSCNVVGHGTGNDAWCIFGYASEMVTLRQSIGLPQGRPTFNGAQTYWFSPQGNHSSPSPLSSPPVEEPPSTSPPAPPNPLGPDFNHDGTADVYAFNKRDAGSGKTVYFILDGRDPTQTLRVGATAFGWLDDNWSIAAGPDFNGDAIPEIYAFNRRDAGSGKTVYFILNGNAPDQFLRIGATPFGWTDANWNFGSGPDFNGDGKPELYAFNRRDVGTGKTVYYVLNGNNPEHQLQVGVTPFGYTDANWSFSGGPDWNGDGTPELYAFNKQDAGSGHTVYFVLNGRDPAQQLQVGALPFTWTSDDWSFAPGGDYNHDGRVDFYAYNRHDGGSGKTVYFYLDGRDPAKFLQVGATPFGWTDGNWSYGTGDVVRSNVATFVAFNKRDPGSGKTVYYKMDTRSPSQYAQVGATPFGFTDDNWSFAAGPDFNADGTPDMYAFNKRDVGSGKTVYYILDGRDPETVIQVGAMPFGWTDANFSLTPGPDFNGDGKPDIYAFNRQDAGSGKTVYYILSGANPETVLQVGATPFGFTDVNWSFSAGADWNRDGKPDLYAFNKRDVGSGKTVYFVLDGRSPENVLQVGATAFGWTGDNYSFTVGPDFNHDGWPDFYGFDKQDAGTGKTVYFVLNGRAPDQFLQIGATAMGFTDANWHIGVAG